MISLTADFGSVINGIAAADAYMSIDTNAEYYDAVLEYAFNSANNEFNDMAAAYGQTGAIKHMFEWGTNGINRQATNVRPQPTEERARLWKTFLISTGPQGGAYVDFEFKPSIAQVPISTAVPQEIRALMHRHVFRWKAKVMEEGTPVTISRLQAQFLLIPYRTGLSGFRPSDKARGYTLTKGDIQAVPGRRVAGSFTAFWEKYWLSRGVEKMGIAIEDEINGDFLPYFAESAVAGKAMSVDIVAAVKMRSREVQKEVAAKAIARKQRGK